MNNDHMKRFDNSKWQTNPLLRTTAPKPTFPPKRKMPQKPPAIKQYGDKGYKPSNGMGVGY